MILPVDLRARRRRLAVRAAACALCAAAPLEIVRAQAARAGEGGAPSVELAQGALAGAVRDGVEDFLGIPYAAPPLGELRFAPPAAPEGWEGVRDASAHGSPCPQGFGLDADRTTDEDCLFVNVQRPVGTDAEAALPVLVLIHGGGLVTGSGNNEDLDALVEENGIVGVTMNYRLSTLGNLALPEGGGAVANWGLRDQQAALRWVRDNIADFGGDPERVTVGGESAGGFSTCAQLAAPSSDGLFSAAFMMSTYCYAMPLAEAREVTAELVEELGCPSAPDEALACLRGRPVDAFLGAQASIRRAAAGTEFLPRSPYDALVAGELADVPLMIGWTRDEGRSFQTDWSTTSANTYDEGEYRDYVAETFGEHAPAILKAYPWPDDPTRYTGTYLVADLAIQNVVTSGPAGLSPCKSLDMTERLAGAGPVWSYEFAHSDASGWFDVPGYVWGAGHATELPYLIPNRGNKALNAGAFGEDERTLATEMRARWGAFVRTGRPDGDGLAEWPEYAAEDGPILSFEGGDDSHLVPAWAVREAHECALWERVLGG